jgi:MATE family multidrug resistance protein
VIVEAPGTLREEATRLLHLAWPVVMAQVGMVALSVVDLFVAGRLGEVSMGAVGIAHGVSFALLVPAIGVAHGVDPLVGQAFGAGKPGHAGAAALRGGWLLLALGVVVTALHLNARPLLVALDQDPALIPEAVTYLTIVAPSVPAFIGFLLARQLLQGSGHVRPAMWAVAIGNLVNLVLDLGLGLGLGPFPALGVAGVAWATTGVRWAMFLSLLWVAREPLHAAWPSPADRDAVSLGAVARLALPVGLHTSLEAWAFTLAAVLAGALGARESAAHAAAINAASLSFMVPLGVGAAASTRVGNLVGAGLPWWRPAWVAVGLGTGVMTISALVFGLFPMAVGSVYTPDPAVLGVMATILPLAALFQCFDGMQAVSFGVLRGLGDTRVPSVIALIGFWGVAVPLELLFTFGFGWGLPGIWTGLVGGLVVVALLLVGRIRVHTLRARAQAA